MEIKFVLKLTWWKVNLILTTDDFFDKRVFCLESYLYSSVVLWLSMLQKNASDIDIFTQNKCYFTWRFEVKCLWQYVVYHLMASCCSPHVAQCIRWQSTLKSVETVFSDLTGEQRGHVWWLNELTIDAVLCSPYRKQILWR